MSRRISLFNLALVASAAAAPLASHACWEEAQRTYGVSANLLYAVAGVESNLNPSAVNRSHVARTRSYGIGLMQIESVHLPRLATYGITEQDLYDPCTNIRVGAWVMADAFARLGVTWDAVGAYNASCSRLKGRDCQAARARYAWRVYKRLSARTPGVPPTATARASAPPYLSGVRVSP